MDAAPSAFDVSTAAGRLMAVTDWASTPIGPPAAWPQSLRGLVSTVLSSRYPMLLLWGDDFTQLYNDAYSQLIGDRHPDAMGNDCRVTLAEGWPVLGPLIARAMATGVASWVPALQLLLDRAGYREEAYFSVSHAPAKDDDGVTRGVLTVCSEVTEQVVGERRLQLLRDLSLSEDRTESVQDTADRVVSTVSAHALDVPFVALYALEGGALRRIASAGPELPGLVRPQDPDPWQLRAGLTATTHVQVPAAAGAAVGGAWGDPVTQALALPLPSGDATAPLGVLLAAVSPSRGLDGPYESFFGLLAQQVGVALRNARAYETERRRAEALAELDRVKTAFFTGVSHEFRTPLTLMLGPLSDALEDERAPLPPEQRERVETARRGAQRLLKLVNNLLTFASLEAGAATSALRPVDLSALTVDVAGGFRSAVERGGLVLDVDCPPLPAPLLVDPEHWQTIVTNLLSNALKFTFAGSIRVRLRQDHDGVELVVEDTGVGIPDEALPRLFERFMRVTGTQARSHEGSGIGLALVRELAVLHGGSVSVQSRVGTGTRFTVRLPVRTGPPVAPADVAPHGSGAALSAAVDEAASWVAERLDEPEPAEVDGGTRVLVVDDNADVRAHLVRLLRRQGWSVRAVGDGREALASALADPPDLLLTDVMMPGLDGFELVRALRADPVTRTLPVVVLSARAGEGASAEGLDLGADDYVVKPFVSADLVARLRSTLELARLRSRHVEQLTALGDAAAIVTSGRRLDDALQTLTSSLRSQLQADGVRVELKAEHDVLVYEDGTLDGAGGQRVQQLIRGRGGRELGWLRAVLPDAAAVRPELRAALAPLAQVLAAVAEQGWHDEREREVASTLQSVLLPERLPEVPGLRWQAAYRPAELDVQVGGDWYDAHVLPDGRVAVSVGDVAGHGLLSALVMGQVRTAVRAYAREGYGPAEALAALDELVARMPAALVTVWLGYLEPSTGELLWSSAGHPPAVLLPSVGPGRWLDGETAPPLGSGAVHPAATGRAVVEPGSSLLLYTDGLVEDREHQLDAGMPQLMARLSASVDRDPGTVLACALSAAPQHRADDVAVLVVQRSEPAVVARTPLQELDRELVLPSSFEQLSSARRRVRALLEQAGVDDDTTFELLVAMSEAINNAVEHARDPARAEIVVRVHVGAEARQVRLEVRDFGQWRPRRPSMDRGHGASLMSAAGEVEVLAEPDGTRVSVIRQL